MTDKEQIIIDGVDVNECKFLVNRFSNNTNYCCSELNNTLLKCPKRDCYFKQLARKTYELEVICKAFDIEYAYDDDGKIFGRSNKLRSLEQECEELKLKCLGNRNDYLCERQVTKRYRKALEEIEKVINNILNSCLGRNTVGCMPVHNVCEELIKILDIINKAKGK